MTQCRAGVCGLAAWTIGVMATGVASAPGGPGKADKAGLDPNAALWTLEISGVAFGQPMRVHMATADGKVVRAFGLGPGKGVHDVDAAGLSVAATSLKGRLKITANPDQWFPKDGKSVESRLDLDVLIKNGRLGGTYKGKRGGEDASGMIVGTLRAPAKLPPQGTVRVELEQAVEGPVVVQRARLSLTVRGGKVGEVQATALWDPRQWKGTVTRHTSSVSAERITGEVTVEVKDPLDVTAGTYTFTLDGKVIGSAVAGRFKSRLGDKEIIASAMFSGAIR